MNDPLARATSRPPAMLGEGCVSRYDPAELTADNGAEFTGAAELWQQLQAQLAPDASLVAVAAVRVPD